MAKDATRHQAGRTYIESENVPTDVDLARQCLVSDKTIQRWRRADNWELLRAEFWHKCLSLSANSAFNVQEVTQNFAAIMSAAEVLAELSRIARGKMRSVATWGPGGVKFKPSDDLTDDDAAIVESVSETMAANGSSLKIKLYAKQPALDALAKYYGLLGADGKPGALSVSTAPPGGGSYTDWTDAQLDAGISEALRAFGRGQC